MSTNPMNPDQQKEVSRLLASIERQRINKPKNEHLLELIQYHSTTEGLDKPLYTAKEQQKANTPTKKREAKAPKGEKGAKGVKYTAEDVQTYAPLVFDQLDHYTDLIKHLLGTKLPPEEKDDLTKIMDELVAMKKQGHITPEEAKMLQEVIETLNEEYAGKLSPDEKKEYWSQVASMYDDIEKKAKKLGKKAKTKEAKGLGQSVGSQAAEDKKKAEAKSQGHESLAQMFIDAILGKFMPNAEGQLLAISMMLGFQNFGATEIDQLLGDISSFSGAANDLNLSTLLEGSSGGVYKNGQDIKNGIASEKTAIQRDLDQIKKLLDGIKSSISDIDDRLNGTNGQTKATDPKVIKALKDMKAKLQGEVQSVNEAQTNLTNLQKCLGAIHVHPAPNPPNPAGSVTITFDPPHSSEELSKLEDLAKNGDPGTGPNDPNTGKGGLLTIYNDLKGWQQDYSNQSSSEQMQLQLTMTEVQQMWTIVSTCMTTLNQSVMSLSQAIYK